MVYALLTVIVCIAHIWIVVYLAGHLDDFHGYNPLSMSLFVLIWMQFCLMSRRFHDSDNAAFFLLPLLIATVAAYFYAIDNAHLADSPFQEDLDKAAMAEQFRLVFQTVGLLLILFALKSPGDDGPNAFGPEFAWTGEAGHPRRKPAMAKPAEIAPKAAARPAALRPAVPEARPLDRVGLPKERRQNLARARPGDFGRR